MAMLTLVTGDNQTTWAATVGAPLSVCRTALRRDEHQHGADMRRMRGEGTRRRSLGRVVIVSTTNAPHAAQHRAGIAYRHLGAARAGQAKSATAGHAGLGRITGSAASSILLHNLVAAAIGLVVVVGPTLV